jgi:hypothetical protein
MEEAKWQAFVQTDMPISVVPRYFAHSQPILDQCFVGANIRKLEKNIEFNP